MALLPKLELNQPRGLRGGLLPTSQPLDIDKNFLNNEKELYDRGMELDRIAREQQRLQEEAQREMKQKEMEEKRKLAVEQLKQKQWEREQEMKQEKARREQALALAKEQREMIEKKREDDDTRVSNRQKRIDTAMDDRLSYMEKSRELEKPDFIVKAYNSRYKELIESGDIPMLTKEEIQYQPKAKGALDPRDPKYKASTDIIKTNIEETRKSRETLSQLKGTIQQIEALPEGQFNQLASVKASLGNFMASLGMNNQYIKDAQTLEELQKSLEKQNLGVLKTFLTGAISNAEGERVASALGTINDRKASLIASYKLMIADSEFKNENRIMENAILDQDPNNLARMSNIINKVQDFPKVLVNKDLVGGKSGITTFYEFENMYKERNPKAKYSDIRSAWEQYYNTKANRNVRFPKLDEDTKNALDSVL